jgi:hypothetical protein
MARTERAAAGFLARLLRGDQGLNNAVGELRNGAMQIPAASGVQIIEEHVAAELAERAGTIHYPVLHVYCDRVVNQLREKFRTFSGIAQLNVDVRVSHDHIDQLQSQLQTCVEAVTDALDSTRGSWGEGMFYTGGYEISFNPVKKGGRNFIQSALVRLEVNISVN